MTDSPIRSGRRPRAVARAAFFDVDHTLTTSAGLFRFLAYWYAADARPAHHLVQDRQRLKAMTAAGVGREETNRAYFALYTGTRTEHIARLARDWFDAELALGGLFNDPVLGRLRAHRASGDLVVLVSGSFPALLEPLQHHVGAHHVLCTEPEIDPLSRTYTGRLVNRPNQPMIGRAKADAVRLFAAAHRVDLDASTAYGDHVSDAPLLATAGKAVVVGRDPELREIGSRAGWRFLPGAPEPAPLPPPPTYPSADLLALPAPERPRAS
ncbi:HAD family hydrolase [Streptomyces sp. WMMC940]|uniref:HAD family hydrolase n=1 Tax=Streptomyces sp. WMMC940 TaxID=3015153 RepID=UPI0022B71AF7|nr:HAD-IB family hydrolase [Streptomyces sp. WMMC940]MCZ7459560.1 HAD-IB family hydrolase [Streptomyces sp. WMMC940]